VGLSSSLSRSDFVANNEQFCFWVYSKTPFSYRAYPPTVSSLFELHECFDDDSCHLTQQNKWRLTHRPTFFKIRNRYVSYPSAFSVHLRSKRHSLFSSVTALLTESNFTYYDRVVYDGETNLLATRKMWGMVLVWVITATVVIVGIVIVWFCMVCKTEVVIRDNDPSTRESFLAHRVQPDGIPETIVIPLASAFQYPTAVV
jgi:hypothetical protein